MWRKRSPVSLIELVDETTLVGEPKPHVRNLKKVLRFVLFLVPLLVITCSTFSTSSKCFATKSLYRNRYCEVGPKHTERDEGGKIDKNMIEKLNRVS